MKQKRMSLKKAIKSLEQELYEEGHLSYAEEELEVVLAAAKKYHGILEGQMASLEIIADK